MLKKPLIAASLVVIAAVAWYLLSPLWNVVEVDEASPLAPPPVEDALETMDAATKAALDAEVEKMKGTVMVKEEAMPAGPRVLAEAAFEPRAHDVAGRALLIETGSGKILRFEDFDTINGPDLRVYLSADLGKDDYVSLGAIRATKGNVNYALDPSIDTAKYRNVLVWCEAFSVLFSYARL